MGKKSDKAKKAATPKEAKPEPPPWSRINKGGWHSKADERDVDVAAIERLLGDRTDAKARCLVPASPHSDNLLTK